MTNTYRTRKFAVGTTKKSTETRSLRWFSRNERHVREGGFARRGISRATVRWDTSRPSLSNSPWMRGAPQRGLACAMVRTSSVSSEATRGRPSCPRRDFQVQNARKPWRCHPQEAVDGSESRSLCSPLEKGELLTQGQVLEREVGAVLQRRYAGRPTGRARRTCRHRSHDGGPPVHSLDGVLANHSISSIPRSSADTPTPTQEERAR